MGYKPVEKSARIKALEKLRGADPFILDSLPQITRRERKDKGLSKSSERSVENLIKQLFDIYPDKRKEVHIYAERIREQRVQKGYSQEQVAEITAVSHAAISKEECGKRIKVSKFFLEAFSLLYQVSPLYLMGLTEDEYCYDFDGCIVPMAFFVSEAIKISQLILINSYRPEFGDPKTNQALLEVILKICKLPRQRRQALKFVLMRTPKMEKMFLNGLDLDDLDLYVMKYLLPGGEEGSKIRLQSEALYDLGIKDMTALHLLGYLTEADIEFKKSICSFMKTGGFLDP